MSQNDGQGETQQLYAWIATDQNGIEGIIAAPIGAMGVVPLVFTDLKHGYATKEIAGLAAFARQSVARLIKFERTEVITAVSPS